jgi:hypothetical protein
MTISPKALPIFMIAVDVMASIVYAFNRDWRHTIYWAAAAVLTACVTF